MTDTKIAEDQFEKDIISIESMIDDKKNIADDIKDRYSSMKSQGYDVAIVKQVIARRAGQREDVEEQDAILATHEAALGA